MNDENRFKELREKEIKRLTTPLTYGKHNKAYDCEGNPVEERAFGNKHILEPKKRNIN